MCAGSVQLPVELTIGCSRSLARHLGGDGMAKSDTAIREAQKQRDELGKSPPVKIRPLGPKDVRKSDKRS